MPKKYKSKISKEDNDSETGGDENRDILAKESGLIIKPRRIRKAIVKYCESISTKPRVLTESFVYLSSVLEQIVQELVSSALKDTETKEKGKIVISRKNIVRGIKTSKVLERFFLAAMIDYDSDSDYTDSELINGTKYLRIFEQIDENIKVQPQALAMIQYLVKYAFEEITRAANNIRVSEKHKSISKSQVKTAIEILDRKKKMNKIMKNAGKAAKKAFEYKQSQSDKKKKDSKKKKNKKDKKDK